MRDQYFGDKSHVSEPQTFTNWDFIPLLRLSNLAFLSWIGAGKSTRDRGRAYSLASLRLGEYSNLVVTLVGL